MSQPVLSVTDDDGRATGTLRDDLTRQFEQRMCHQPQTSRVAAAISEQPLATGGRNTRPSARPPGGRTGLEHCLDGGGHELRSFRVDDDVPAEQHAADDLPGVPGRVLRPAAMSALLVTAPRAFVTEDQRRSRPPAGRLPPRRAGPRRGGEGRSIHRLPRGTWQETVLAVAGNPTEAMLHLAAGLVATAGGGEVASRLADTCATNTDRRAHRPGHGPPGESESGRASAVFSSRAPGSARRRGWSGMPWQGPGPVARRPTAAPRRARTSAPCSPRPGRRPPTCPSARPRR